MNGLASLIADIELALQDDLHLVVGISVNEGSALFKSVDATADGLLRVDLVTAGDVAEEGVPVGDHGRLELGLDFGEIVECWCGAHFLGCWGCGFVLGREFAERIAHVNRVVFCEGESRVGFSRATHRS